MKKCSFAICIKRIITCQSSALCTNTRGILDLNAEDFDGVELYKHVEVYSDALKAVNTEDSESVCAVEREINGTPMLKKHSWNMLIYKY